ncbi:MAG: hypothetical protein C5B54_05710 [Acidobacteria bacterium]|nr:MAG: hypothetical protein C5B54_05710 [Acidobacteriota bacterium]
MAHPPARRIELGCGKSPTPGYVHHDRWKHDPWVDLTFDLEDVPWPIETASCEAILALDVFEHLRCEVQQWLDECWRILTPDGTLEMRLPAWDHSQGYGYRDITHHRVFHQESFWYFCPNASGSLWRDFGQYYWGARTDHWWWFESVEVDHGDYRYKLRKRLYTSEELEIVACGKKLS